MIKMCTSWLATFEKCPLELSMDLYLVWIKVATFLALSALCSVKELVNPFLPMRTCIVSKFDFEKICNGKLKFKSDFTKKTCVLHFQWKSLQIWSKWKWDFIFWIVFVAVKLEGGEIIIHFDALNRNWSYLPSFLTPPNCLELIIMKIKL